MKLFKWLSDNILFIFTLFLLAFIPLYPKLPVIDINHTWVYIRAEDFIVALAFIVWTALLVKRKITLKTPLTTPIILFWIIGAVSTIHGILLIFPSLANVFPNVAFLNYLRKIEYISLFFIAYAGIKEKKYISYTVGVLAITVIIVAIYGIGQKYLGFPAFLTMNEEFAKGIPIRLSPFSRVSSTFGGHYDLAAYLVLIIPLLSSLFIGFKNLFIRFFLLISICLGFVVLFMTVSRVSFFVLLLSLVFMLFLYKKKLAIFSIIFLFLASIVFLSFSSSLQDRFGNTVKKVDVIIDAKTGEVIGNTREIPSLDFKDKIIKIRYAKNKNEVYDLMKGKGETAEIATKSSLIIPYSYLPAKVPLIVEPRVSTGENLPEGTGYINLTLTPIKQKIGQFFYPRSDNKVAKEYNEVLAIQGNFLIKTVSAYDLSFTTRFQGEWPHALELFRINIFLGGGYSVAGLAVDNNYLRILGEVGLFGFASYLSIFLIAMLYTKKILPNVDSPVVKSFILGLMAGVFGLSLNALLIDVFEASKIAFVLWLLIGVALGTLHLYQREHVDFYKELRKLITSKYAIIVYLFIITAVSFSGITNYYFVGDDFTWFRWISECNECSVLSYFTQSDGFFYRPGAKIYFLLMYKAFWLNQTIYHMASIFLHFVVAALLFLLAQKILKNIILSSLAALLFIILSGYQEAVFWISATGFLFTAVFVLSSLLLFIAFDEKKKNLYLYFCILSIIFSLLFHELGVVTPLIIVLYRFVYGQKLAFKDLLNKTYYLIFAPVPIYLVLRLLAGSHWFNGDYSYNLLKLPFNFVGNIVGYLMLLSFGPKSLSFYQTFRNLSRENIPFTLIAVIVMIVICIALYKMVLKKIEGEDRKIVIFGFLFFAISLLPFLGLGNITSRYSYLASIGFVIFFVFFVKKIYGYLVVNGWDIALGLVVILIGIFSLINIINVEELHKNWKESGEKTQRFIISLNELYEDEWQKEQMRFYFVNVPTKHGNAWVFPVGLKDAVWFVFRNDNIAIFQYSSLSQALNAVQDPNTDKVFEFQSDGSLLEKKPQVTTQ